MNDPEIDRFLDVLLKELQTAEASARANAGVIGMADTPVPMLRQIAAGLRNQLGQIEHMANRADELADGWQQRQG
jgi:hypothetical protein